MKNSCIAYYEPGPNWIKGKPLKDQPLTAHDAYLIGMHECGKVSMGGPFHDGSGGLVIFDTDDIVDVNDVLSQDPAIVEGILIADVKRWTRIIQ